MAEERSSKLPTSLTPYVLGAVVLALITIFGFLGSIPWPSKAEMETLQAHLKFEIETIRVEMMNLRRYDEHLEIARREAAMTISGMRQKLEEMERRVEHLEGRP
jgi:hypothetical protein